MSTIASKELLIVSTPTVPGWKISQTFGLVSGESAFATGPIGDLSIGLDAMLGGQVSAMTTLVGEARDRAVFSAREAAFRLGANAIVGCAVDYETISRFTLVSVTGTAVRIESDHETYEPKTPSPDGDFAEIQCQRCGLKIPRLEPHCPHCAAPRPD